MAVDASPPLIVVLGAPNDRDGTLSPIARSRVAAAVEAHRGHPRSLVLPTGGHGPHFNESQWPHHELLAKVLIDEGIGREFVLPGIPSRNTVEDASGACRRARELSVRSLLVVTSEFHGRRAEILFGRAGRAELSISLRLASSQHIDKDQLETLHQHEESAIARLLQ